MAQLQKVVNKCLFCNIIEGVAPAAIVHQDDKFLAFKDIKPASKFHFLIVPKEHIDNVKSIKEDGICLVKEMVETGEELVNQYGGNVSDCRMGFHWPPFNSINHLHLHVIFPETEISWLGQMVFRPNSFYFATPEATLDWLQKQSQSL